MTKNEKKQQILEAFQFRHATKRFDPNKKISQEDFDFILETGRLSPSSFGFEPWKFVIVQNMELREKIKQVSWGAQGQALSASHFMAILARTREDMIYGSDYLVNHMRTVRKIPDENIERVTARVKSFQEEDFQLLDSERALFDWSCRQAYIAMGNMMTAAAQIGIDSCPIEGFNHDQLYPILEEAGALEGGHFGIACMVAFGYRIDEQPGKVRRDMDSITKWIK